VQITMPEPVPVLACALREQLRGLCDADLDVLSAALAEPGGFLDPSQDFMVPAAAVLVGLGRTLEQLLSSLQGPVTRSKAAEYHLEALMAAALAALTSSSQDAGVQEAWMHLSDKAPRKHVTSRSSYLGLLQAAADTTGARSTQQVRASLRQAALQQLQETALESVPRPHIHNNKHPHHCCQVDARKPKAGKLQGPPGKVPALHFPCVKPSMAPEEVEAAVLAAVCSQLGRTVPPAAEHVSMGDNSTS
jgi:hypothetical protein